MSQYLGQTVLREYSNSPTMLSLLAYMDQWIDTAKFTTDFLAAIWNIDTAFGYGLDVWGRILGRGRHIVTTGSRTKVFGFDIGAQPGTRWQPWNQAPFNIGLAPEVTSEALDDADFRRLLLVKAASNIAQCNVPAMNALVRSLFIDRGRAYVLYDLSFPMRMTYRLEFTATLVDRGITQSGVLPEPAGMTVVYQFN